MRKPIDKLGDSIECIEWLMSLSFFLTSDIAQATAALNLVNGYLFKGKPVIIQYGRRGKDPPDKNEALGKSSEGDT